MNIWNELWIMWLKVSHLSGLLLYLESKKVTLHILYFASLQFTRKEWSVAPSIFNIKAQGLAHCLYSLKLILDEVYEVCFHAI